MYHDNQGKHRDIPIGPTWHEIESQRMDREDRAVRNRLAEYQRRREAGYMLMAEDLDDEY